MKALVVLGAIATTLIAATVVSDRPLHPKQEYIQSVIESVQVEEADVPMLREDEDGLIYEYPSIEDASIIEDISQDSLVHLIMFQEKTGGDAYSIK